MPNTVQHECVFKALNDDEHLVYGEVYAPLRPDSDGDIMDADTIKKMAHDFLRTHKLDQIDVQHDNNLNPGASVVESFIARKGDDTFIEGSWVVGVHIPDADTWNKVKKGEINGFSIEALVTKTPQTLEVELPPVINGITTKSEDHEHQFFVTFDGNGAFMGGRTNIEKGHFHTIRAGTITDTAQDHNHKFSFVEGYTNPTQMAAIIKAAADCEVYPQGIKPEIEITEESPETVLKGGVGSGRRNKNAASGPWVVHNLETGEMHSEHPSYGKAMNLADKMNNVHFETATPDQHGMISGKYGAMAKSSWDAKNAPVQAQKEEPIEVEKAAISATGATSNGVTTGATQVSPPPESTQPPNKENTIQSPDTKPLKKKKNILKQAIQEAVYEALKSFGVTSYETVHKDWAKWNEDKKGGFANSGHQKMIDHHEGKASDHQDKYTETEGAEGESHKKAADLHEFAASRHREAFRKLQVNPVGLTDHAKVYGAAKSSADSASEKANAASAAIGK